MHILRTYMKQFQKNQFHHFDDFYDATSKYVFFTLKKYLKDAMLIEDLMQDIYIKFVQKVKDIQVEQFNITYLTTMARNKAIDHLRKVNQNVILDDTYIHQHVDIKEIDQDYIWLLDQLSPSDKEIVFLHVIEGLTFKEMSTLFDRPLGTLYSQYQKALTILKEAYHEHQKNH